MTFRYIGSKARLVDQLLQLIGKPDGGVFVDAFCGTGAVAAAAADLGWSVHINDSLRAATTVAAARLMAEVDVPFRNIGGYIEAVRQLNAAKPIRGFIWREYSPKSIRTCGLERRYFTENNASRIDGMRELIRQWRAANRINGKEEMLLLADLLGAINRVANIAGTYGCFLRTWTSQAKQPIEVIARELREKSVRFTVSNVDALLMEVEEGDTVYFDPPYTKRQYASYYHIPETVVLGDEPKVEGVSGLRPWKELASVYCYKTKALPALIALAADTQAKRVYFSYSNAGHVSLKSLSEGLSSLGTVTKHGLGAIGSYRPNQEASKKSSTVSEYLVALERKKGRKTRGLAA